MQEIRIYPSITTTKGSNWPQMIRDCFSLGVKEVAFFPTCIDYGQRKEAYYLLKKAGITSIPFVHLRSDMSPDELVFLIDCFSTKIFNIHCQGDHHPEYDLSEFSRMIYLENSNIAMEEEIRNWAGICLDVSHLEDKKIKRDPFFGEVIRVLENNPCGCWHLNAISQTPLKSDDGKREYYDIHYFRNLSDLDYCLAYKKYLAPHIALELENTIIQQLEAKKHIEKILGIG